jgi:ribonuclease J
MTASLIIHRGTHQIGGCVTEISSGASRVFIDMGADLPGRDVSGEPLRVNGLTEGDGSGSALFITHYHADHVGRMSEIMPGIPVYMGETAKAIMLNLAERIERAMIPNYEKINTFSALDAINVGDITVTPLMVDHSAFDSYMFVIEAGGKRVLHTGDFRTHGPRGRKTFAMLRRYAPNIDYIICEGTMLSRSQETTKSEYDLQREARAMMSEKPYVFVLCSSTNIDRIGGFYHANPEGRLFVCDEYQKKQLDLVAREHGTKSDFYDFRHVYSYAKNLDDLMEKKGFCMLVRCGDRFKHVLEKYKDDSLVIYSMWPGYLGGQAKNQNLIDFLNPYPFKTLHTSGHATTGSLAKLYRTVNPKEGLIPIHSDSPEIFRSILPDGQIIFLEDGEILRL